MHSCEPIYRPVGDLRLAKDEFAVKCKVDTIAIRVNVASTIKWAPEIQEAACQVSIKSFRYLHGGTNRQYQRRLQLLTRYGRQHVTMNQLNTR